MHMMGWDAADCRWPQRTAARAAHRPLPPGGPTASRLAMLLRACRGAPRAARQVHGPLAACSCGGGRQRRGKREASGCEVVPRRPSSRPDHGPLCPPAACPAGALATPAQPGRCRRCGRRHRGAARASGGWRPPPLCRRSRKGGAGPGRVLERAALDRAGAPRGPIPTPLAPPGPPTPYHCRQQRPPLARSLAAGRSRRARRPNSAP